MPAPDRPADNGAPPIPGLASPSPSGLVGETLAGRYRLIELLGSGAMGEVYLGEHLTMGRHDAIKVLSRRYADDPDLRSRFLRGARNLARIRHPNVCAVYDFGETDQGAQFLAIEYVPGGTLGELVARTGPLPVRRACEIAIQIAQGLQAAHDQGIVHRDLKPENVMLAQGRDGEDQAKVVDFDIAKGRADDAGGDSTQVGALVGTPRFMSPEQLLGDSLDGRSDLYSLGIVTFWMLTGRLPFEGDTAREMTMRRLEGEALALEDVAPGRFPPGLDAELRRVLSRAVEGRHDDAGSFAAALAAIVPDTEWEGEDEDVDDPTLVLGSPLAMAAVRATHRVGGTILASPDEHPTPVPPPTRGVSPRRLVAGLALTVVVVAGVVMAAPMATRSTPAAGVESSAGLGSSGNAENGAGVERAAGVEGNEGIEPGATADSVGDPGAPDQESGPLERGEERPVGAQRGDRDAAGTPAIPPPTPSEEPVITPTPPDEEAVGARRALQAFAVELSTRESATERIQAVGDSARTLWSRDELGVEVRHWSAYVIALSEYGLGDAESALTWVDRALALDPENRGYRAFQEALRARRQ